MYKKIIKNKVFTLLLILSINSAFAERWCQHGTIVTIQDVTWSQNNIIANYPGAIPSGVPDYVITGNAMNNYGSSFAGGGGSIGGYGYTVPGSGTVIEKAYAPSSFLSGNNYSLAQGVQFKLKKCYTVPPMTAVKAVRMEANPNNPDTPVIGVTYSALEGAENLCHYWSAEVTDPDEDDDFDGDKVIVTNNNVTLQLQRDSMGYCR